MQSMFSQSFTKLKTKLTFNWGEREHLESNAAEVKVEGECSKKHFVLVHGAGHGAWCWYKLAVLLESAGHQVTVMDLAACGINLEYYNQLQSIYEYVQPLMDVMDALPTDERVVLVGHSYGGIALALAMEAFPQKISIAVFASAVMPPPGSSLYETFGESLGDPWDDDDTEYFYDDGPDNPPTGVIYGPKKLATRMYQQSPPEDLKLATTLIRITKIFNTRASKDTQFTEEKYGSVPRAFVLCMEDKLNNSQRETIEKAPVDELKEIDGADHMVMLSKPQDLSKFLLIVAGKYV